MRVASGSYTGNGTSQTISVGFAPRFVVVKQVGAGSVQSCIKYDSMPSGSSHAGSGGMTTNGITAFGSSDFSVGSDAEVNTNASTYHWFAIGGTSSEITSGTYTGNGSSQTVNVTIDPVMVMSVSESGGWKAWCTDGCSGVGTMLWSGIFEVSSSRITALTSSGFTVGNANQNLSGQTYDWIAFAAVAGSCEEVEYTGNGSDNRNISCSFTPEVVIVSAQSASFSGVFRDGNESTDTSHRMSNAADAANWIQTIGSNNFQVGSDTRVNQNTTVYTAIVFKDVTPVSATGTPALKKLGASVAAKQSQIASSASNLPKLVASGSLTQKQIASGASVLAHLVAALSGNSTLPPSATGTPVLAHLVGSASALHKQIAAGTPALPHLVAAASATQKQIASSAANLPHLVTSASGVDTYWTQRTFRFRNDDGSESTATWIAGEGLDVSRDKLIPTRLRLQTTTEGNTPSFGLKLQYRKVGDSTWVDIA